MSVRILALVGSLRAGSTNRQLAEAAPSSRPGGCRGRSLFEGLGDIPFYNEDIDVEGSVPAAAAALREAAQAADALPALHPRVQRHHPGRAEERHRLAVASVRRRRPRRQAGRRRRYRVRSVRRRLGAGRDPQGRGHRRRQGARGRQALHPGLARARSPRRTRPTTPRSRRSWPRSSRGCTATRVRSPRPDLRRKAGVGVLYSGPLSFACGPVGAGRAHAAEPHIDTAPRPFGARLPRPASPHCRGRQFP